MKPIEKEELQIEFALQFANYLVDKKYDEAFSLLSVKMKEEFSAQDLEKEMLSMTNYFEDMNNIRVDEEFTREEGANFLDNHIYIPIIEDGNNEAIWIEINDKNESSVILNLEFGRP